VNKSRNDDAKDYTWQWIAFILFGFLIFKSCSGSPTSSNNAYSTPQPSIRNNQVPPRYQSAAETADADLKVWTLEAHQWEAEKTTQARYDMLQETDSAWTANNSITGCPTGCKSPPLGCNIKGNISFTNGEKIYHLPGQKFYEQTTIDPAFGERWFCTEEEARSNGWRRSYN
jgi:hypothetical protein